MNPTAAAAAELVRNADGSAQNAGKYATVPKPSKVKTQTSIMLECGRTNHAASAIAAVKCGKAKCQRRSRVRAEVQPRSSMPIRPAPKTMHPKQITCSTVHPGNRSVNLREQNPNA